MEHKCSTCNGTGKVTCPRCGGYGKIQGETCYYCHDGSNPHSSENKVICPACKGEKVIKD